MDFSHRSLSSVLGSLVERGKIVTSLPIDGMNDFIKSIILKNPKKEPFYVMDLGVVVSLMQQWTHNLPNVNPFYAVKCNPNPSLLSLLAGLGTSFDCASQDEIESVLALGVSPDKIIFANPCKQESHIKYAAHVGVNLATFDSSYEVKKIRQHHPKCNLLIRVKPPRSGGKRDLGKKYGALPNEVEPLLQAAKAAGLSVLGVSFHIGSGDADPQAFISAIAEAREIFDTMTRLGMGPMTLLDIGGGFSVGSRFESAANNIKSTLKAYFHDQTSLTVISEPGRFIAETAFTLVANVIGKRVRGEVIEYWINDGAHGSMNHVYKDTTPVVMATPFALTSNPSNPTCHDETTYSSTVFGPTCDGDDIVMMGEQLPELQVNDWLVFPNMGAYTSAVGTNFNGFKTSFITTHLAYLSSN